MRNHRILLSLCAGLATGWTVYNGSWSVISGLYRQTAITTDCRSTNGDTNWANYTITLTATFQPDCTPPMTVVFTGVTVTDVTNGISQSFPGTF